MLSLTQSKDGCDDLNRHGPIFVNCIMHVSFDYILLPAMETVGEL